VSNNCAPVTWAPGWRGWWQVREKQLTTRVQYEVNDQAENEQLAQRERDATELEVQTINLNVSDRRSQLSMTLSVFRR
jgi:hypothetical protein